MQENIKDPLGILSSKDPLGILKKKDGGVPAASGPSASALQRLDDLKKQLKENQLAPQRTELPKQVKQAKEKAEFVQAQEQNTPKVAQMMVYSKPTFKVEYPEQEELTAKVLGFQNAQQKVQFEQEDKEKQQQKVQQAADEFYKTSTGKFYYNFFKPLADAGARAIGNTSATVSRLADEDELADAIVERFTPEKRYEGTIAGNTPTKLQGGLFNDGKANWAKLPSTFVRGLADMLWLVAPAGLIGKGEKAAQLTTLMANSFLQTREDYYQEGKAAGLKGDALDNFSTGAAVLTSALESISPNRLVLGGFKTQLAKDYAKQIASGITTKAALKAASKAILKGGALETAQEVTQLAGDKVARTLTDMVTGENNFGDQFDWNKSKDELYEIMVITPLITTFASGSGSLRNYTPTNYEKAVFYDASKNAQQVNQYLDNKFIEKEITEDQYKEAKQKFANYNNAVSQVKNLGYSEDQTLQMAWELFSGKEKMPSTQAVTADPILKDALGAEIKRDKEIISENIRSIGMGVPNVGAELDGKELSYVISNIGDKGTEIGQSLVDQIGDDKYRVEEVNVNDLYNTDQDFKDYVDSYKKGSISADAILVPAVIKDGKIVDGRARLAEQYLSGKNNIKVFKNISDAINQSQVQEGRAEGDLGQPQGIIQRQPEVGQGEGSQGQTQITQTNVGDSNIGGQGAVVTLAPFFDTTVKTAADAQALRQTPEYKRYVESIPTVAKAFGLNVNVINETIGGFENAQGNKIVEISNRVFVDSTDLNQVEKFAAIMGTMTPETQEATIAAKFIAENETVPEGEYVEQLTVKVSDVDKSIEALQESGIYDFTIDESDGSVSFLDFSQGTDIEFEEKIANFERALQNRNIQYETAGRSPVQSKYISPERRTELIAAIKSDAAGLQQGGESLRAIIAEAEQRDKAFRGELIQELNKDLTQELSQELVTDPISKAAQSLKSTGVSIDLIEDPVEYDTMVEQLGGQRGTEGVFLSNEGRILLNKSKLNDAITAGRIVWHESSHPVINIIRNTNPELYNRVISGMKASDNPAVQRAIQWANDNYQGQGVIDDESIVEAIAMVADGTLDLNTVSTGLKQSIIDFINLIARALGFNQVLNDTDVAAFKKLAGQVADVLTSGRDVAEVVGRENVKEYMSNIESPELVGGGLINLQPRSTESPAVNVYESKDTEILPKRSLQDVYDQYEGKAVVINSDPTRVGELTLPSGKKIFMYGGPGYLSLKDNVNGNVGFATTQIGKVNTWMKYVNELFGEKPGVTLVATQAPTSILSNSYALRYVMDGISQLPKSVLRSSDFKNEFFGKDLVLLKDAFGEKAYNEFVNKYKKADLSNPTVIDGMISEMAYKVGDDNKPASFKARGAFVSNLLGGIEAKKKLKTVEGDAGYVSKKPTKYVSGQLFNRLGINAEKVIREIGEPSLVDLYMNEGKWGMAVSGFETDLVMAVDGVQAGGVKHPLFNAKFPGKNPFILDGAYDVNQMFAPIEMTGPSGAPYTKTAGQMLAGSMYVKGQPLGTEGSFEYQATPAVGGSIQASVGNRLAPNGKPSNLTEQQYNQVRTPEFKNWFGDWENDPANASKVVDENGEPRVVFHGTNAKFDEFKKDKLGSKNFMSSSAYTGFFFAGDKKTSQAYVGINNADWAALSIGQSPILQGVVDKYKSELESAQRAIREVLDAEISKNTVERETRFAPVAKMLREDGISENAIKDIFNNFPGANDAFRVANKINKENGNQARLDAIQEKIINEVEKNWLKDKGLEPTLLNLFLNIRNPFVFDFKNTEDKEGLTGKIKTAKLNGNDGVVFNNLADGGDVDDIFVAFEPNQIKSATANVGAFSTADNRIQASVGNRDIYSQVLPDDIINSVRASLRKKAPESTTLQYLDELQEVKKNDELLNEGPVADMLENGVTLNDISDMLIEDEVFEDAAQVRNYFNNIGGLEGVGVIARIQASVGARPENNPNFKLGAFVMRKKAEGATDGEIAIAIASVTGMKPEDIKTLIDNPEQYIRDMFPSMTKLQQDNLIQKAKIQNIYRGRQFGKPIDKAFIGLEVPQEYIDEYMQKTANADSAVKKWATDFKRKWLDPTRGLPDWVLAIKDFASGSKNIEIARAAKTIERLKDEAKKIGFSDWEAFGKALVVAKDVKRYIPNEDGVVPFDAYRAAAGKMFTTPDDMLPAVVPNEIKALPDEIIPYVYAMRGQIDNLTRDLIGNGYVTPEQAVNLENNIGQYVNRSYRLFNEMGYKPEPEVMSAAIKFLADDYVKKLATDKVGAVADQRIYEEAIDLAKKDVDAILNKKKNPFFNASVDRRNTGILQQRQEIPEPLRKLMGEYTDPGTVFMMTVAKQAALKASSQYLNKLRENGMGSLFFEQNDPSRPASHSVQIAAAGTESMNPLGGLYTTPEIAEAIEMAEPTYNELTQAWMKLVGAVRWGKTVASVATQFKNFESNGGFAVLNGYMLSGENTQAFKAAAKYVKGQYSKGEIDAITDKVIRLNLVGQSVGVRELKEMLGSGDVHDIALDIALNPDGKWGKKVAKKLNVFKEANKLYRLGDDFWKVYAYMIEREQLSDARFNGSKYDELTKEQQDQIDVESSERVKNTWPTYDRVVEGAKFVSKRAPIFGNFISFQAESLRVLANSIKLAKQDMADPQLRHLGVRRAVGIAAYFGLRSAITIGLAKMAGFAAAGVLGAAFGDDEEERNKRAIKQALPPFMRTSDLAVIRTKEPHKFTVISLSSLDPYAIIPNSLNAYTEGREGIFGKTMDPGVAAATTELFSSFLEPEMTFSTMWSVVNNIDPKTKQEIVLSSDSDAQAAAKVGGKVWDMLEPSSVALVQRFFERKDKEAEILAIGGARPYDVDLHKSFGYILSQFGKDIDAINREYNSIKYREGMSQQDKDAAEMAAEDKKAFAISKLNETYRDFMNLGADPKVLNELINQRSSIKVTGFDKNTKNSIKTGKINKKTLFK